MVMSYTDIEALLRSVLPEDCKIFQANMPFQTMDALARASARICTYLVFRDRVHINTSGITPVHQVTIEFSLYGQIEDVDSMAAALAAKFAEASVVSEGWTFDLVPASNGKRDVWEPNIQAKREYLQYQGIAIAPEE